MENKIIENSFNGLLIVKARNANFNAGFDGSPRTLPDGTIFATDKALKYCIREYLANFKEENVFVRRNRYMNNDKEYVYETLRENFEKKCNLKLDDLNSEQIIKKLKEFMDIRLFGVVFSVKASKKDKKEEGNQEENDNKSKNISFTGPVQISYGMNKLKSSSAYPVQILSPYTNPTKKNPKPTQTTIGEQTRADEVYYAYNISINSENAKNTNMTFEDLKTLKESLLNSVDMITSCTKYGCESVALIWLSNKENIILNNLDEFIEIKKEDINAVLNLSGLKEYLKHFGFNDTIIKEHKLDFDYAESNDNSNTITAIYKKGKILIN